MKRTRQIILIVAALLALCLTGCGCWRRVIWGGFPVYAGWLLWRSYEHKKA